MDGSAVAGDRSPTLLRMMRALPQLSAIVYNGERLRQNVSEFPIKFGSYVIRKNGRA